MNDDSIQNEALLKQAKRLGTLTLANRISRPVIAGCKRSLSLRLKQSFAKRINAVTDLVFKFLVKCHPTQALSEIKQKAKEIHRSGVFDNEWYREKYKIRPTQDPVIHYLTTGADLGFNPNTYFKTRAYLKGNPEAVASKLNPLLHYLRSGNRVKRIPSAAACANAADQLMAGYSARLMRLDRFKKTILLVSDEMSATSAPVLLLNIGRKWREQYNIVILSLRDGLLESEFKHGADVLICPGIKRGFLCAERFFFQLFQRINSCCPILFSIVNSIASQVVIKPLSENRIPSLHLIHELPGKAWPRGLYRRSARYASCQIYPASFLRDHALREAAGAEAARSIVLPQGRVENVPGNAIDSARDIQEEQRISELFRPRGFPEKTVIVAGMGPVQFGGGVDLFVACAARVLQKAPTAPFRFIWIGNGFDPETNEYSLYLADQIHRSGLKDVFKIFGEFSDMGTACDQADLLFLSSRLDALPSASQAFMARAKPVVCFEDASGVAEYLKGNADTEFGVVSYLDAEEAASRIFSMIDDARLRREIGLAFQKIAVSRFCFDSYASRLQEIGLNLAAGRADQG